MPSLLDLPNEIVLQIISNIDANREDRILGHDPNGPTPLLWEPSSLLRDFFEYNHSLCSLALTCKRISSLVPEELVFAPVFTTIAGSYACHRSDRPRLLDFIRMLVAYPERTRCVKQLHLSFPLDDGVQDPGSGRSSLQVPLSNSVVGEIGNLIELVDIPLHLKAALRVHLEKSASQTLMSMLLGIVPQLQVLCISGVSDCIPVLQSADHCCLLGQLPFRALRYLKIENRLPMDLNHLCRCAKVHILDLSIVSPGSDHANAVTPEKHSKKTLEACPPTLNFLRLDFQTKTVGTWNHSAIDYMRNLLQTFRHLKGLDFYAEPSNCKNPYRSVRAFPHYQTSIQDFPDISVYSFTEQEVTHWDQRIYDARTEITDYQCLVDSIAHLRPCLETLRLPGGFWTLPGGMRKPLPRFDKFQQLKKLVVPQVAIIVIRLDNMLFNDVAGDFALSPATVLPPLLRHLQVFDADASFLESNWLLDLLGRQLAHRQWPALDHLAIRFGSTVADEELDAIIARKSSSHRMIEKLATSALLELVLERDDDVPLLWSL